MTSSCQLSSLPESTKPGRIVLVSMPFGPLFTPSIALGLLASELRNAGFETETLYFTIPFAKQIGVPLYEAISSGVPETSLLLGDWLFRDALFGTAISMNDDAYMSLLESAVHKWFSQTTSTDSRWKTGDDVRADLVFIRRIIEEFLDHAARTILDCNPVLVGFTTVFQQNTSSLALSKRLKAQSPATKIVFGGANCESVMGTQLLASFPQIDYVVSGEGEEVIIQLASAVSSLATTGSTSNVPAGLDRTLLTGRFSVDLNSLAYPEYDSYFRQVKDTPEVEKRARLLFESSRGCWWVTTHPVCVARAPAAWARHLPESRRS
jgi:hypothetical protein